jgi:RES domain-containing protein
MLLYQISKKKHSKDLSGTGAKKVGGRFNSIGKPVVYTASSIALASLEILVHMDKDLIPENLMIVELDLPEGLNIEIIKIADLGKHWNKYPAPKYCQNIGDNWINNSSSVGLQVPSAIIKNDKEFNIILNPSHVDFKEVKTSKTEKFTLDPRLF